MRGLWRGSAADRDETALAALTCSRRKAPRSTSRTRRPSRSDTPTRAILDSIALMRDGRIIAASEITFPEVKGDFVERALLPFFGLGQPENSTLGIQRGAFSAHLLLTAYLRKPVHEPTPKGEAHSREPP